MSIRINLLPHREERRKRQKNLFFAMTGLSALAGAALVLFGWMVLDGYVSAQRNRNEIIARANARLDVQIHEIASLRRDLASLRAREKAVEDLQSGRNEPVYLFGELTRLTPDGVFLRSIDEHGSQVRVEGWAASNERVSEYLRNLQDNGRFVERPQLIEIRVAAQGPKGIPRRVFEFSLEFLMKKPSHSAAGVKPAGAAPTRAAKA